MADERIHPEEVAEFVEEQDVAAFNCMVETLLDEYVLLGLPDERILEMFHQPSYEVPFAILQLKGEPFVRQAIRRARKAWALK